MAGRSTLTRKNFEEQGVIHASDKREALRAQAEMGFDRDNHVLHHGLVLPELTGIVRPVAGRIVGWE